MDTDLAVRQISLENMMTMAEAFARSGFFKDANDQAKAVVKIQAGRELGIPPVAAMTGINIVQGKISLSANIMASLVKRHPLYNYHVDELHEDACIISFLDSNGDQLGVSTFTMGDAQKAGLAGGVNWKKYPRNMLFARAMSNGVKWYCPDVMGGVPAYTPDEMGQAVDQGGGPSLWASSDQLDYIRGQLEALFPDMTFANDGHYNYMLKRNGYPKLDELTGERAAELIDQFSQDPDEAVYDANGVDGITAEPVTERDQAIPIDRTRGSSKLFKESPAKPTPQEPVEANGVDDVTAEDVIIDEHTGEIVGYAGSETDADEDRRIGKDPAEIIEQGKAATGAKWSEKARKQYFVWLNDKKWTPAAAKEALGVESMNDYAGTIGEAFTALTAARAQ